MSFVTLIRPPAVSSIHSYSTPITPPIGVAYLAANLERFGHRVAVIDALGADPLHSAPTCHPLLRYHGLSIEHVIDRIDPQSDAIGISAMFSIEWPHTEQLVLAVRERFPDIPIILGGEHATAAWEHVLTTCPAVDACVLGEGEATIVEIADKLRDLSDAGSHSKDGICGWIPGTAVRRDGVAVCNPPRPRITDLDSLPRPAWHLVPLENYLEGGFGHGVVRGRSMPILATRGCPYACAFCSSQQMWTRRYVARTPSDVADEIEEYVNKYQATNIDFYDLTAIIRREWILDFCRELHRRKLDITWQLPSGTRSEALDAEVLRWLYRTGCRNITYAPESGSLRTLQRIHKQIKLSRMCESIRAAHREGILLKCNLVIGFPGETRTDILRTLGFAMKLACMGVDDVPLYLFSPYPGSEFHEELRSSGVISEMNNDYFASLGCFMDLSQSSYYCGNVGPRELNFYRTVGMAAGYALGYLLRPWRTLRTAVNVWNSRGTTVLEQRLCDLKKRWLSVARTCP